MSVFTRTALAAALLAAAPLALAQSTTTDTMQVSITIENACTITANPLEFGTQTSVNSNVDAATTVVLDCSAVDSAVAITFGNGAGAGATFDSRKLTSGANTIDYSLFVDSSRTQHLGDGAGNGAALVTDTNGNTGSTGTVQTFDVYGRVFGGQGPKPVGAYTDTVVATVSF